MIHGASLYFAFGYELILGCRGASSTLMQEIAQGYVILQAKSPLNLTQLISLSL